MKTILKVSVVLLTVIGAATWAHAQGTAFTYQGRLNENGVPATGTYDLQFTAYDSSAGPTVVAGPVNSSSVAVAGGLFTVTLDFGTGVFTGPARWLQIAVRTNGAASFAPLNPRQPLTPSPYAIHAGTASNVATGVVVKSFNNLRDNVSLLAGANVTLTPIGNSITIAATNSGGGSGPWALNGASAFYNGGPVGVGTTTPTSRLTVAGAGAFNSPLAAAITLDNTTAARRWEWHALDDGRLQLADFTAGLTRMMFDLNGNVGIGTTTLGSKLTVQTIPGGYGLEHTDGNVRLSTFLDGTGGWLGTVSNHKLHFYANNSVARMTMDPAGSIGIGTTSPQTKQHLYDAANSVSQRIESGGGVNSWSRLELKNANGQWDLGTSRSFNGDQFYVSRLGSGIAFGLQPNGDAFLARNVSVGGNVGIGTGTPAHKLHIAGEGASGYAIGIEGHATQNRDKGGWVKAMAKVNADGTIARQFSAFGGTITALYGGSGTGYLVTFPFQVNDRFISVTPLNNESLGPVGANVRVVHPDFSPNQFVVFIYDADDVIHVANEFFIFVY